MRSFTILSCLAVVMLAACGTPRQDGTPRAVYWCKDGSRLDVMFEDKQAVITTEDGRMITLPQQDAASGILYSSGKQELRGKGKQATWTVGRRTPTKCVSR